MGDDTPNTGSLGTLESEFEIASSISASSIGDYKSRTTLKSIAKSVRSRYKSAISGLSGGPISRTSEVFGSGISGPRLTYLFYDEKSISRESDASDERVPHSHSHGQHINLIGCIIVIVGCVLGSGIFAAPQEILNLTSNAASVLLVWFVYGILALVGALCYVELGCTIPVSGGDYAYLKEIFGALPAFLFQWSANFIVIPVICAVMCSVVAKNLVNPYLEEPIGEAAGWASCLIAIMLLLLFCYINCVSPRLTEKLQGVLMIVNLVTISLMCICGVTYCCQNGINNSTDFNLSLPKVPKGMTITGHVEIVKFQVLQLVRALYQASFSYLGYTYVTYITEEVINPFRNLPLGICISIPVIIVINLFVNFCYIATLSTEQLTNTQTIGYDMFKAILPVDAIPYVAWVAPTLVAVAVSGGCLSNVLACSRIAFTGARFGHFPKIFAMVHVHHRTPVISIAWMGFLGSLYILSGSITLLISIATYLFSTFNCSCIYALLYLRFKRPTLPRPIKLPIIIPITYSLVTTFLFLVPIVTMDGKTMEATLPAVGGACFVIVTGVPIYFLFIHKNRQWRWVKKIEHRFTVFLQKLLMIIPEDELIDDDKEE